MRDRIDFGHIITCLTILAVLIIIGVFALKMLTAPPDQPNPNDVEMGIECIKAGGSFLIDSGGREICVMAGVP